MAENIRSRQDHIEFLENYIDDLTEQIDKLSKGQNFEKEIESLKYRIEVLESANGCFPGRIAELKKELAKLEKEYNEIKPLVEELVQERAYYRKLQTEIQHQ